MSQNAVRLPQESNLGEAVPIRRGDGGPGECLCGRGRRGESASPIGSENLDQPPARCIRECLKLPGALPGGIRLRIAQQVFESVGTPFQSL